MKSNYEKVIVTDSRLLQQKIYVPKLQGASNILYKQWTAAGISTNAITFVCPNPDSNLEIDRNINLLVPVRLSFAMDDVAVGTYLLEPNLCNLRSYPIQKALSQIQMTINNHSMVIQIGDIISALENYNTSTVLKNLEYSTTSTYGSGQSQKFSNLPQGSRSELALYTDSICGIAPQSFPFTVVSQNPGAGAGPGATAVIDFVSTESVFLSPLYWGSADDNFQALSGVNNMNFTFNFQENAGFRMFAIDPNSSFPLGSGAITVSEQYSFVASDNFSYSDKEPKLLMQYIRPQIALPAGTPCELPYYSLDQYPTTHTSTVAAQVESIIKTKDITLPRMPSKIFIFARKPNSVFTANPFTPDANMAIEKISVTWNTRNVLSTAHKSQLYQISVKNGVQMDYTSWSGYGINDSTSAFFGFGMTAHQYGGTGSIICLDVLDLGISDDMSQYPEHQISLQIDATVKNIATDTFTPVLYVVTLCDGIMSIVDGIVSSQLGVTDTILSDPIRSKDPELVSQRKAGYFGGAHKISSLKNLFRRKK